MRLARFLPHALRAILRRDRLEADLDAELKAYVDELTAQKTKAGLAPGAARRAALIETGGVEQVKEDVRREWAGHLVETAWQDARYAWRGLRRSPLFAVVAVATLALGIGANTAIFSVVNGVLLRPAPVGGLDRLVMLWETDRQTGTSREPASIPDFVDFRARATSVRPVGALVAGEANMTAPGGEPRRLAALRVSADLLPMLGFEPLLGRQFTAEETRPGGPGSVLISESLWAGAFARDPNVLGKTLRLDDAPLTVVGVVPDSSDFGVLQLLTSAAYSRSFADRGDAVHVDAWLPLQADARTEPRETHSVFMLGRLSGGATRAAAQREFEAVAADLERTYASNRARGVFVEPLGEVIFGRVRPALLLLAGAVALVLLVACVNVANLLLARGASRAREIALRRALGGGMSRLVRQFIVESLVLALISAVAGLVLAWGGLRALVALAPADIPGLSNAAIDYRVLGVTLALSVAVALAFGLVPASQARRLDVLGTLGGGSRATGERRLRRRRYVLVAAEVCLAVVLMTGAGLLIRSFWLLGRVDAGFQTGGVLKAEYQLPRARYPVDFARWPDFKQIHAFTGRLLERASVLPGVASASVAGNHPLDPGFTNSFAIVGREAESAAFPEISVRRVTPGYFRTVGLKLVRGRPLDERDRTTAPAVIVINETASKRFFPTSDPLGARIRFWGADRTVVGIVGDERFHGVAEPAPIGVYTPLWQTPSANGAGVLLLRTTGDPSGLAPAVRRLFRDIDPELAVFGVEPLDATLARTVSGRRFLMVLLAAFAMVAIVLAAVGIHGVVAYTVAQRTPEFGVRMALGARPSDVLGAVVREMAAVAGVGLVLGALLSVVLARFLAGQLFGVAAIDPVTLGAVAGLLGLIAVAAAATPARRATKVDPAQALRSE